MVRYIVFPLLHLLFLVQLVSNVPEFYDPFESLWSRAKDCEISPRRLHAASWQASCLPTFWTLQISKLPTRHFHLTIQEFSCRYENDFDCSFEENRNSFILYNWEIHNFCETSWLFNIFIFSFKCHAYMNVQEVTLNKRKSFQFLLWRRHHFNMCGRI